MNANLVQSPVRHPWAEPASSPDRVDGMCGLTSRETATLKVLIVDDCPLQQLLSSALLSRWGIRPQFASDGLEAVLLAGEQRFDLILMDIQMGVLDGVAATIRIRRNERRRREREVPIVAYTAEPIAANDQAWAEAGITAILAKPCQSAELSDCLMRWCIVNVEPLEPRTRLDDHPGQHPPRGRPENASIRAAMWDDEQTSRDDTVRLGCID